MNSNAREEPKQGHGLATTRRASWPAEEEELETGEPIPDEMDPAPAMKKIPAARRKFNGEPPSRPEQSERSETSNASGGQMVLSSAKYLKKKNLDDADAAHQREKRSTQSSSESQNGGANFESRVLNGGTGVGALAMGGAALWFVVGLMNDTLFFYPPVLFILGLIAFFKGLAKNE